MKKKLLSLVLAGAMVASTSVSAFAEDKTYTITEGGQDHQVTIKGDVQNEKGEVVAGTISVTVPTAMAFTINKDGTVEGGRIEVVNKSKEQVEVVAKQFTDTTPDSKIVIVKESALNEKIKDNTDASKRYMSLSLTGNGKSVGLVSGTADSQTGFINENENEITTGTNPSLGNAWESNSLTLELTGRATRNDEVVTYTPPSTAIQDKFNLVLKIQKTK